MKTDGLYLNVITTEMTNQINKIGIFLPIILLANNITAKLMKIATHAILPL